MDESNDLVQGKLDEVEVRAAEIARREGRDEVTNEDRRRAFHEMREMDPANKGR